MTGAERAYRDALLTVEEVAAWLRVEPGTVRRWAVDGSGPARVKVGSAVRYRRAAVEEWISERTVEASRRPPRIRKTRHQAAADAGAAQ